MDIQTGVIMILIGVLVSFGSFVFALINMMNQGGKMTRGRGNFGQLLFGHIGAMIGVAVGGLTTSLGILWVVVALIQKIVK